MHVPNKEKPNLASKRKGNRDSRTHMFQNLLRSIAWCDRHNKNRFTNFLKTATTFTRANTC